MGRKRKGNPISGWINLNKPYDMTSTDAVARVRRLLRPQKIGHGGTLDPLATGVLPLALGEATKMIPYCQENLKTYSFTVCWGESRTTDDAEGEVIETSDIRPTLEEIEKVLPKFTGEIEQVPPKFSAIKVDGQRAYDLARQGEEVELKSRIVYVEELECIAHDTDTATFHCLSGKGTYVRSLARDIAQTLGTVGYVTALMRDSVGSLRIDDAISLEKLEEIFHSAPPSDTLSGSLEEFLLPVETVLDDIPALAINEQEAVKLKQGQSLLFVARPDVTRLQQAGIKLEEETIALAVYKGKALALVTADGASVKPIRVLNL